MAEDRSEELLIELLKMSQRELACVDETYRLTTELADAFSKNDQKSARILIGMRGTSLSELEKTRIQRAKLLEAAGEDRARMERLLRGEDVPDMNDMEKRLKRLSESFRSGLKRTVELDKRVNRKIAQEKSYYQE